MGRFLWQKVELFKKFRAFMAGDVIPEPAPRQQTSQVIMTWQESLAEIQSL